MVTVPNLKDGWRGGPRCDEEQLTTRTLYTIFCGDQEKSERKLKIFSTDLPTNLTTNWGKNEKPSGFLRAARSCGAWRIYLLPDLEPLDRAAEFQPEPAAIRRRIGWF